MPNNAASRCHALLANAKQIGSAAQSTVVWSRVLALKKDSPIPVIAPHLIDLYNELESIEEQVKSTYPEAKATQRLKYFPAIKEAVAFKNIQQGFAPVAELLTDAALDSLEVLAHDLDEEPVIEQSDMDAIWAACDDLFNQVVQSDLNPMLKKFVLEWISKIRRALERYRISGVKGLREALCQIQGEAFFMKPAIEAVAKESPTVYERVNSLFNLAVKAADFKEKCEKIYALPYVGVVIHLGLKAIGLEDVVPPTSLPHSSPLRR